MEHRSGAGPIRPATVSTCGLPSVSSAASFRVEVFFFFLFEDRSRGERCCLEIGFVIELI